jgi:hypothetical protein
VFTGSEIVAILTDLGFTHVVWVPDSLLGTWERDLEAAPDLRLIRVCREGEAWPLAAGLTLGGAQPLLLMQTTGLFESGDALRNILYDLRLPLLALVGARSWLVPDSSDSARTFTLPIVQAWGLEHTIVADVQQKPRLADFLGRCLRTRRPGLVLVGEDAL